MMLPPWFLPRILGWALLATLLVVEPVAGAGGVDSFNRANGTDLTANCGVGDRCGWTKWGSGQDGLRISGNTLLCDRTDNLGYCNATFGTPAASIDQQCSFQPVPYGPNNAQQCCVRVPTGGSGYFLCLDARTAQNAAIHTVYRDGELDTFIAAYGFTPTGLAPGKYAVLRVEGPGNAPHVRAYVADDPGALGTPVLDIPAYGLGSTPLSNSLYGGVRLRDLGSNGQIDNFEFGDAALAGPVGGLAARPINTTCIAPDRAPQPDASVALAPALGGVALSTPTAAAQSPLDSNVWYVAERAGRLQRVDAGAGTQTTALDLSSRASVDGEGGLLGVALHPSFAQNGQVFAYYTRPGDSGVAIRSVLSRFTSTDGGLSFLLGSEQVLVDVPQSATNHVGGTIQFGPDGKLYLGLGDGGDDPSRAQNLGELRGKLLRVNVDAGSPYAIPPDNPFVGVAGARGEIWALGFRNPYRWSFDAITGALWVADVGESSWEEIDLVTRGGNYGWPAREGAHCRITGDCNAPGLVDPIVEYSHFDGCAVIGGFVSRGASLPGLAGTYVYGDLCSRTLWGATPIGAGSYSTRELLPAAPETFVGFAQARDGELLVLLDSGAVQLVPGAGGSPGNGFPLHLVDTGCVDGSDPARPASGMVPYDLVTPFWSDGAAKERWLALPEGAQIVVAPDGDFTLPPGSVTMKQFRLGGKLIETRFFVRHGDGSWGGYTYEWNETGTDATLLAGPAQRVVNGQTWSYPSQAQCLECHTAAAGFSLGLESAQLNRDLFYPTTGRTANQLTTLSAIGMFQTALPEPIGAQPRLEGTTTNQRARAWLHSNCAGCHRPGGPTPSAMDLRHGTSFAAMGVCNVVPTLGSFGISGARLLEPADASRSILSVRAHRVGAGGMPPLARSLVDLAGVGTLDTWIRSIPSCATGPDGDGDGLGDTADNCPSHPNATQADSDGDGIGDVCEVQCRDGLDNDGDGRVDYPLDAGCPDALATIEGPACSDGLDNDGDGKVDGLDVGCKGSSANNERPACADGVDNDRDGKVDWDGGPRFGTPDPQCAGRPWRSAEAPSCGLGAELALLMPSLSWLLRRRVAVI